MSSIDQIMVQKVGGWVMLSSKDWFALKADELNDHINNGTIQFWSHGELMDARAAAASLKAEPVQTVVERVDPSEIQPVNIRPARLREANYQLAKREGSRLFVVRVGAEGEVNLSRERSRSVDFYDQNRGELAALAGDLVCDSYGDPDGAKIGIGLAKHLAFEFDRDFFKDQLWSINAEVIRDYVIASPYLGIQT